MNRQQANREILSHISAQIEAYPDLRFHQILQNIDVVVLDKEVQVGEFEHDTERYSSDKFHEESEITLDRVKNYFR